MPIEANMQNTMRIYLNGEEKEKIEPDNYFSKANYGSRKNYSIETAILQTRLMFDHSLLEMKPTVCDFTNLQLCYD